MNKSAIRHMVSVGARRVIAVILTVSLLLIPVRMPGASAEEYHNLAGTTGYTQDVKDDITYQWDWNGVGAFEVSDGRLSLTADKNNTGTKHAIAWLNGSTSDGVDTDALWTNYTVEAEVSRKDTAAGYKLDSPALLGRKAADGSYFALICGAQDYYAYKYNADGTVAMSKSAASGLSSTYAGTIKLKIVFSDKKVQFYINDGLKYTYTDTAATSGGIGLRSNSNSKSNTAYFDNVKVTLADGTVAYSNGFGKDITYKWNTTDAYTVQDGKMSLTTAATAGNSKTVLLDATAGDVDVAASWKNYSIQADVTRNGSSLVKGDRAVLMGRVNEDGSYYWFGFGGTEYYLMKTLADGSTHMLNNASTGVSANYTGTIRLKLSFEGDNVIISISEVSANGTVTARKTNVSFDGKTCKTHTGTNVTEVCADTISSGGIGLRALSGGHALTVDFDNVVVNVGGAEVFKEEFNAADNGFDTDGLVAKNAYSTSTVVQKEAYTRWSMAVNGDCEKATVTVTDPDVSNNVKVKVNGQEVTLTEGKYTINSAGEYTIEAEDADGKKASKAIKIGHTPAADDDDCTSPVECTVCHQVVIPGNAEHTPVADDGDCTSEVKCKFCEQIVTPGKTAHDWDTTQWAHDGEKHWRDCLTPGCTEIKDLQACSGGEGDCQNKPTCDVCGNQYASEGDHKWATELSSDGTCHFYACTVENCDGRKDEETCSGGTADCQHKAVCAACNKPYGDVSTEHKWSDDYTTENGQHWKECTVDGCDATTTKTACSGGTADCQNKAVCAACNKPYGDVSTSHKWATEWSSDGTCHFYACTVENCDERKDEETCSGGTADCQHKAVCATCNKPYGDVSTEHKWSDDYTTENGQHWKECTVDGCDATTTKTACSGGTADCQNKPTCDVCGNQYASEGDHKWATKWTSDGTDHWHECEVDGCAEIDGKAACSGGTADCQNKAVCSVCEKEYGELDIHNHTKDAKWSIDADKHSKVYECCGAFEVEEAAHTGGTATCKKQAQCRVCGEAYGKFADHTGGEATCTEKAVCEVCDKEYGEVSARNHTGETVWIITDDTHKMVFDCCEKTVINEAAHSGGIATCESKAKCAVCGEEYGELDPNNHTKEVEWVNCGDNHSKVYACCGEVVEGEAVHTGGEATCEKKAECAVCGEEYGKLADHKGGEADCEHKAVCTVCGEEYGELDPENHRAVAVWALSEQTHKKAYACCGVIVIPETAHTGGEATCEKKAECVVCGEAYGELAAHKGGEATCTDKAKCEVCGETYGELDADNHGKDAKWTIGADKHSKAYECCGKVVVAEAAHTGGTATCEDKAVCSVCNAEYGELGDHKGGEATCTDKAKCEVCGETYGELNADNHAKDAKWTITGDKHSKAYECCGKVVVAEAAHTGGEATCEKKAECAVCGEAYGELAAHKGGEATCTDKAKCEVCGETYGELNADNHAKDAKWTITGDKHSKAYECCGKVVVAEAAHNGGTATCEDKAVCSVCNAEYGELAAHKGGEATCTDKAKCEVCGKAYGELDADNHTKEAKWSYDEQKHTKKYKCCGKVVVAEAAHKLTDGKCECGYEKDVPIPVEPGEIENTTDEEKNACGGSLDVKDEHLEDKLLTEEEKQEVQTGADINIYLTVEDISDKVSKEDKEAVEKNLNGMKVGLYLDINLQKQVGNKTPVKITETNGHVTVTITVPKELRNTDSKYIRTYKVIRVHEGKTEILDAAYDAKTNKLSFQTDKFSTYTLIYSDAPSSDNSNTGDNTMIVLFSCLVALSALAAGVLLIPGIRKKILNK